MEPSGSCSSFWGLLLRLRRFESCSSHPEGLDGGNGNGAPNVHRTDADSQGGAGVHPVRFTKTPLGVLVPSGAL